MSKAKARAHRALANQLAREVYVTVDWKSHTNEWHPTATKFQLRRFPYSQESAFGIIRKARKCGTKVLAEAEANATQITIQLLRVTLPVWMMPTSLAISKKQSSFVPFFD